MTTHHWPLKQVKTLIYSLPVPVASTSYFSVGEFNRNRAMLSLICCRANCWLHNATEQVDPIYQTDNFCIRWWFKYKWCIYDCPFWITRSSRLNGGPVVHLGPIYCSIHVIKMLQLFCIETSTLVCLGRGNVLCRVICIMSMSFCWLWCLRFVSFEFLSDKI